uniref:Colorectal mutant cancer protein n=1 Tax=Cacopsylla melanoneura TaxID=428564 RepID=A0A8D9B249_9HEMI
MSKELSSLSACSEDTHSISDEEKIRQLFQVCDSNGDGYIDSHDLAAVCQDLNLNYCLDDLLQELGADQNGKISYQEFLQKRLSLKPEIDALRKKDSDYLRTNSDISLGAGSLGKHECWEFDSGARDLSPEPNTLQRLVAVAGGSSLTTSSSGNLLQLANKLHLAALSSLRNEILDLNTRLQNVTEERDMYEKIVQKSQNSSESHLIQQYEEQVTELRCVIAELSRKLSQQKNLVITEEDEFTDTQSVITHQTGEEEEEEDLNDEDESNREELERSKGEKENAKVIINPSLKPIISHEPIVHSNSSSNCGNCQQLQRENELLKISLDRAWTKIQHLEQENELQMTKEPVMKVAEKVHLKKLSESVYSGVSHTQVAEHLVSNLRDQCSLHDRKHMEIETEKLNARLEHVKIQNSLLELNVEELKTHCERLTTLLGKYESNAIALELALSITDKLIETYRILVDIVSNPTHQVDKTDILNNKERLEKERANVGKTIVTLESYHVAIAEAPKPVKSSSEARKLDLEMAVLMQELLSMREDKAELKARIYSLEHEKDMLEMKLSAQANVHQLSEQQSNGGDQDDQSGQHMLRSRLREMTQTLDRVTRTYELRHVQSTQLTNELKQANNSLIASFEKGKKKSQSRLKRLENEIVIMAERHSTQVQHLKQRILSLEEHIARLNNRDKQTVPATAAASTGS